MRAFWSTDWYHVKGNGGIKWEDHGGGWMMDESTTIKVSGTKHVQCTNNLYVDQRIGIGTSKSTTNIRFIYNRTNNIWR